MSTKQEKISKVSKSIFFLESKYGHLKWKVTDLERTSKVSRTLIYRYFGNKKTEIFENALNHFIDEFYGFDSSNNEGDFLQKIFDARLMMLKNKEAVIFYQNWRLSEASLSNQFQVIEAKFQKKLKILFPNIRDEKIPILHGFIHGMITAPFLSPDQAIQGLKILNETGLLGKSKVNFN